MELEARVQQLESSLEKALLEIDRAQAAVEIQSVMGRYAFYYTAQRQDLIKDLWSKRDDASIDIMGGAALINKDPGQTAHAPAAGPVVGLMRIHSLSTPVIAVADDCSTARATWISPGVDSEVRDGKAECSWCWIKYGVDFIKEDGQWKLWHLTSYGLFHTNYYKSWGDGEPRPLIRKLDYHPGGPESRANFIPIERVDWTYAADRSPELEPIPPAPYGSWDEIPNEGYRTW